jgi:bacterioferritin (cytochrome b1)
MRVLILCVVIFLCHSSVLCESDNVETVKSNLIDIKQSKMDAWKSYKDQHSKVYESEEDATRFEIFKETLKKIEEHNAKYARKETTFKMGLNQMSDWTPEEKEVRS